MPIRSLRRAVVAGATATATVVLAAAPALAHVEPDVSAIPAGEATTVALTIGHGCDESPTTSVAVQLPAGLESASGVAASGWTIDSSDGVVTWTAEAGEELPSDEEQSFELELTPSEDQVGDTLYLKTVQTCEEGENRWIDEGGAEEDEPENPAPAVEVLAAGEAAVAADDHHGDEGDSSDHADEGDHHGEEGGASSDADHHGEEAAATDESSSEDDGNAVTAALVVLVIAAIGLGGVALMRSRRPTP